MHVEVTRISSFRIGLSTSLSGHPMELILLPCMKRVLRSGLAKSLHAVRGSATRTPISLNFRRRSRRNLFLQSHDSHLYSGTSSLMHSMIDEEMTRTRCAFLIHLLGNAKRSYLIKARAVLLRGPSLSGLLTSSILDSVDPKATTYSSMTHQLS